MTKRSPVPKLDPAASLIERLGGVPIVAGATGKQISVVHRWTYPRENGGTGGLIPLRHFPALSHLAREKGIEISADDFMPVEERAA